MPYITRSRRAELFEFDANEKHYPQTSGELNYEITELLINYLDSLGKSYASINDCVGALECAKAEFYRRVVVPYEECKIMENGDVY